jgi:hypothetical protein
MNQSLKGKLIAGFILVFIAGGMTGAFAAVWVHARHIFVEVHNPSAVATHMKQRLRSDLDLTEDQVAKISPIVEKTATQLEQIRMETGQRVHDVFKDSHREISAFLNEDQKGRLQEMEKRHRRGNHSHGPGGPHHPPPPDEGPEP